MQDPVQPLIKGSALRWRQRLAVALIARYQRAGGSRRWFMTECNFTPTCSEYTRIAILRFGVWRGVMLGIARIRRCTDPDLPEPKCDPVPVALPR